MAKLPYYCSPLQDCRVDGVMCEMGVAPVMPRYFFAIYGRSEVKGDTAGTYLPDAAAALSYAEYTIRELRKESGYTYNNDPALMMIVKDEARQTVLSLPFFPGC